MRIFEMPKGKKVLIVGTGTIGEPLIHLCTKERKDIGLGEIFFYKRSPLEEEAGKVKDMIEAGAQLVVENKEKEKKFLELGLCPVGLFPEIAKSADVIVDCTPEGNKLKEGFYNSFPKVNGFIAQGSEKGFGKPYAWTINDSALVPRNDKFIQIVSCNTHQMLCILKSIAMAQGYLNLQNGIFTIIRRASDVSEDKGILGVEFEKYSHPPYGSHQADDTASVLKTIYPEKECFRISAQALKVPTQLMHTFCFNLELKSGIDLAEAKERLRSNPLVAFTKFKSNNKVFARARDSSRSILGRILNQTVFCEQTLGVSDDGLRISGGCFTPQDGNALLSSVAATLWLLDPKTYREKMKVFDKFLFDEI